MKNNTINRNTIIVLKEQLSKKNKTISPNSNIIRVYKNTLKGINKYQRESAIGHLLGDARIERGKSGCIMKFEWGDVNKEYAFSVFEEFKPYILSNPRKQERINKLGNINTTWCFQTITHEDFNFLGDIFLQGNKKVLSNNVYKNITPRVLGRWFMDDGGINGNHSHGIQFNTQGFSAIEVNELCNAINSEYYFEAWIIIKKGKPVINVPASKYTTFVSLTKDHIEKCITHKLVIRLFSFE